MKNNLRLLLAALLLAPLLAIGCWGAKGAQEEEQAAASERLSEQTNAESATTRDSTGNGGKARTGAVARAGNAVARAGGVVTQAGDTIARAGGANTKEEGSTGTRAHPTEVTLEIDGSPETELSGTCTIGDKANKIGGEVPKTFTYEPDGQRLNCHIRMQNPNSGTLKVMFTAGDHTTSVQQSSSQGGAITLQYDGDGGGNLSLTTSGSGGQANSSSHVSVLQSNSTSGRDSH
jgi:hypothetical protein